MIVVRDKSIKILTKCEPFIRVITDITIEEYLTKHNERYSSMNEPLKINLEVLREMKLNQLNIA